MESTHVSLLLISFCSIRPVCPLCPDATTPAKLGLPEGPDFYYPSARSRSPARVAPEPVHSDAEVEKTEETNMRQVDSSSSWTGMASQWFCATRKYADAPPSDLFDGEYRPLFTVLLVHSNATCAGLSGPFVYKFSRRR